MTILEKFLQVVEPLTADQLTLIDAALAKTMKSHSVRYGLTDAEQLLVDHRVAELKPEFASNEEIAKIFGKPFSA